MPSYSGKALNWSKTDGHWINISVGSDAFIHIFFLFSEQYYNGIDPSIGFCINLRHLISYDQDKSKHNLSLRKMQF